MAASGVVIAMAPYRRKERRQGARFVVQMPAAIAGDEATTRDLSSSGLAFTAPRPYAVGERVDVEVEYILDGHHYPLRCAAEVVRVEPDGHGYRMGARRLPS